MVELVCGCFSLSSSLCSLFPSFAFSAPTFGARPPIHKPKYATGGRRCTVIAVSGERRDGAVPAQVRADRSGVSGGSGRSDLRRTRTIHHTAIRRAGQSTQPSY